MDNELEKTIFANVKSMFCPNWQYPKRNGMKKNKISCAAFCLIAGAFITTGCMSEEEERAAAQAKDFAENYFNLRFEKAYETCTDDSRKWIAFRASNITERDLEAVRNAPEEAYVSSVNCKLTSDSTAIARCTVHEALAADSLEQRTGRILEKAEYAIPLVKQGRRWRVRMEGPLRNVK